MEKDIMAGRPIALRLEVSADTDDNTISLATEIDANGDGVNEDFFSDKKLMITKIEVNVASMTGEVLIVVDKTNTIYRKLLNSEAINADEMVAEDTYSKAIDVFSDITVKKTGAPSDTSEIYIYGLAVPNRA